MAIDTFICGMCNEQFHDIAMFLQHKSKGCVAAEQETEIEQSEVTMVASSAEEQGNIVQEVQQIASSEGHITTRKCLIFIYSDQVCRYFKIQVCQKAFRSRYFHVLEQSI